LIDAKALEIMARWHRHCVLDGVSGRWMVQLVMRDGQVVSYVQPPQARVFGISRAKLADERNVQAFQSLERWLSQVTCDDGRVVVYVEYTNGVTSPSRVNCGVLAPLA
jgi:ketosteroid isomerase-like protein